MNKEKLLEAKRIEKDLSNLQDHLKYVKDVREWNRGYDHHENRGKEMSFRDVRAGRYVELKTDLLPIEFDSYIDLYESKLEKKIQSLEKEFENL